MSKLLTELEEQIQAAYEQGITVTEAEKLAAKCLSAMLSLSKEVKTFDLDSRMRKSGLKAIRAAIRSDAISSADKKPTEGQLDAIVDMDKMVIAEVQGLDEAEVQRDELTRQFLTYKEAHIYFRGVAKAAE